MYAYLVSSMDSGRIGACMYRGAGRTAPHLCLSLIHNRNLIVGMPVGRLSSAGACVSLGLHICFGDVGNQFSVYHVDCHGDCCLYNHFHEILLFSLSINYLNIYWKMLPTLVCIWTT